MLHVDLETAMSICKEDRAATYTTADGLVTDMARHDMKSYQTI
jgi:hypothetical protein